MFWLLRDDLLLVFRMIWRKKNETLLLIFQAVILFRCIFQKNYEKASQTQWLTMKLQDKQCLKILQFRELASITVWLFDKVQLIQHTEQNSEELLDSETVPIEIVLFLKTLFLMLEGNTISETWLFARMFL